jgi:hypothetical protein
MRCQVLTAASIKVIAFWDIAQCSLVEIDLRFRGGYCLHHQGDAVFMIGVRSFRVQTSKTSVTLRGHNIYAT